MNEYANDLFCYVVTCVFVVTELHMEQCFIYDGCVKNDHLSPTKGVEYAWKFAKY